MPPAENQPDDARVSSAASWAAGSSPFVADAGPQFDPEQQTDEAPQPLRLVDVAWMPDRVRTIVRGQGLLTHEAIGVGEEDWLWRESELAALAEPAANVLNKFPVTRAAAAVSDELTVGAVMFEYAFRSMRERTRILRERKAQAPPTPQPITGYDGAGDRVIPEEWRVPE